MSETDNNMPGGLHNAAGDGQSSAVDSRFRLVVVAAQRSKQLVRGARPRVATDPKRQRSTSIALEEVRLGLVPFINNTKEVPKGSGTGGDVRAVTGDEG